MAQGNFVVFDKAKEKIGDGTIDLDSHTFIVILCDETQALSADFVGSSGNCQYSDIKGELPTANGYTQKNKTLASVTWGESGGTATFDAADVSWTLSGSIEYKYAVLVDDSATNDDLLGYFDANTDDGSATVAPAAGTHTIIWNAAGIFDLT